MRTFLCFALLFPCFIFSQKIQLKKDKLLFNEKEVGILKSPYRDHFEFYDLNNEKVFDLDLKGVTLAKEEFMYYLDMKSADGKTTQIPYEILITSFKPDRIIAHQLAVKYKLFNEQGFDKNELETFFNTPRENLADKYLQIKANSIAGEGEKKSKLDNIRRLYNPRLGSQGEIFINNGSYPAKLIGYAKSYNCVGFNSGPCLEVRDLDGVKVGTLYQSSKGIKKYDVETYDNNKFTMDATRSYAQSDYAFVNEFIVNLFLEGYTLEHQAYYKNHEQQQAKVNDAINRSINLYDVPGYLVEKSGKKTEGMITIWFEMLDTERTGQKLPEGGADKFGQRVTLKKQLPGMRSMATKIYDADSGIHFCVSPNGSEECYYGLDVKGEFMKKMQNYGSLYGNNSYFYRLIAKENKIMLLQDPVETQKYVIKTDLQPKGQMLDNRSNYKLSEKLAEYLKDCKVVYETLKKESFDLKNEENLRSIISEYDKCKK
ncbi:hypothetical protein [Chryseobacterium paridis]|uniref:GLPGLI family protein n=1 Tax=Chryseobacterium paridis TaxID=2800328 RepID=A0ABS1FXY9_9FLAO|nr:hypothetical protein [Chryseobacterium paridis]MBK1897282.1 hypothetical protein [Chryseobacterium paridis]